MTLFKGPPRLSLVLPGSGIMGRKKQFLSSQGIFGEPICLPSISTKNTQNSPNLFTKNIHQGSDKRYFRAFFWLKRSLNNRKCRTPRPPNKMQMNVWDDQKIPSNKPKAQSMKLSTGTRARKREHRRSQALLAFTKRWPYLLILLGAIMNSCGQQAWCG